MAFGPEQAIQLIGDQISPVVPTGEICWFTEVITAPLRRLLSLSTGALAQAYTPYVPSRNSATLRTQSDAIVHERAARHVRQDQN